MLHREALTRSGNSQVQSETSTSSLSHRLRTTERTNNHVVSVQSRRSRSNGRSTIPSRTLTTNVVESSRLIERIPSVRRVIGSRECNDFAARTSRSSAQCDSRCLSRKSRSRKSSPRSNSKRARRRSRIHCSRSIPGNSGSCET